MKKNLRAQHASKNGLFYKELVLFSVIYLAFFVVIFLPILLKNGFILRGDGYNMYYPSLLNFRRTLLEFYQNVKNGTFEFPMINFNHGLGIDNYTMISSHIAVLPYYIFCVFLPESWMAPFLTVSVILLDFLAGIAFLRLGHHFSHRTYWNSLMAAAYCFSSPFFSNYMLNPHFMNMLVAFPLMIIGMDRLIQRKGWRLLCFCIFWLSLASFTLLVYTLPFLALFAIIRIAFLYKSNFTQNLFKAIVRSVPVVLAGFLLSGVVQLPVLYLLKNSPRSIGNPALSYAKLFSFNLSRISQCFSVDSLGGEDIGVMPAFIAVPGTLLMLLVVSRRKELRTYMLTMMVCIAFPIIDCGINGFQYCLIRWGAAPALVFSFAASVGMTELFKLEKKKIWRIVFVACMFGILSSLDLPLEIKGRNLCAALIFVPSMCRMVPTFCSLWARLCQSVKKRISCFISVLKENSSSVKHYISILGLAVGIVCFFGVVILVILLPDYHLDVRVIICAAALIILSVLMLAKKEWTAFGIKVLGVALTISMIVMNLEFSRSTFPPITPIPFYQASQEFEQSSDSFNRVLFVTNFPEEDENHSIGKMLEAEDKQDESAEESLEGQESSDELGDGGWRDNYGLGMAVPDASFFHNMIDNDMFSTLVRCGQDISDFPSMTYVRGYSHKEVLYSLFGIKYFGTTENELNDFGMKELFSYKGDDKECRVYEYQYSLPIGVTYDSFISKNEADKLGASEYPYALLNCAFAEDSKGKELAFASNVQLTSYNCDFRCEKVYHSTNSSGFDLYDHHITLNDDTSGCFLYFEVSGGDARHNQNKTEVSIKFTIDGIENRRFSISNFNSIWPWTRIADSYSFALGYYKEGVKTIDVRLPMKYDEIKVYAIPASRLTEGYEARCNEVLENVNIATNQLEGDIELSSDKLLSVGLIHNDGWSVEVDGKPASLYKINGLFIGTKLTKGNHHVRFVYRTAWLNIGILCSAFGILMWIMMEIITRRKHSESKEI